MGVCDQIKTAFQDIIAPELHALRRDIRLLDERIDGVRTEMVSLRAELLAEIRRVDTRIDSVDRELRPAVDVRERLAALEARRSA
jgi:predicted  nucleic acid-binding Zn-ribbon protein